MRTYHSRFDALGRVSRITRPGSYIKYVYNARNWITEVHNRKTDGTVLYDAEYYYNDGVLWDSVGNPLKRVENWGAGDFTTTFRYDRLYRLTEETKRDTANNVVYSEAYAYDAVGNRLTLTKDGTTYTYTYNTNDNDKLASISGGGKSAGFAYDANGNIISVSGDLLGVWSSLVYDDENQLTEANRPGGRDTYEYNVLGQRLRSTIAGYVTRYIYFGDRVAEEDSGTGTVLAWDTLSGPSYGDDWLHMKRWDSGHCYPLLDGVGTVRELVDGTGTMSDAYTFDTFGVKMANDYGTTKDPYRFGGDWGYFRESSGLYQLGARFYWPDLGRFIQQDPVRDGMNWYAYVENNPAAGVDPEGLNWRSNWRFFWRWVTGRGPSRICYGPGSLEVNEMKNSPGVNALRRDFYNKGGANIARGQYSTPQAYKDLVRLSRWPYTDAQVGGFDWATVTNNGNGTVTFDIPNLAGTQSFFHHMVPNRKGTTGPMHNVYQRFTWTETINPHRVRRARNGRGSGSGSGE